MEPRPKLKPEPTNADRLLEAAGWLALAMIWLITIFNYKNLPDTIPTHFNIAGEADNYGNRSAIFFLPVLGTVLFIGMTILNRFPHVFNFPVKITPDNALRQYSMATRLIRVLKLSILVLFILIIYLTTSAALNKLEKLSIWFLPLTLAIIFIPLVLYIIKSFKEK
jgi:uncharacterized membrane protein